MNSQRGEKEQLQFLLHFDACWVVWAYGNMIVRQKTMRCKIKDDACTPHMGPYKFIYN